MTTIDAHQHFWRLARGDYRFPSPGDPVLYRDFLPDDLEPRLADAGVTATILVQATDTVAETAFLLELAARSKYVAGVIGWCDPRGAKPVSSRPPIRSGSIDRKAPSSCFTSAARFSTNGVNFTKAHLGPERTMA